MTVCLKSRSSVPAILFGMTMLAVNVISADVFVLKSGAKLQGRTVPDETNPRSVRVETSTGIVVQLNSSQIVQRTRVPESIVAYDRIAPKTPDNSAEQWKLSLWCRENKLEVQQREHARRAIELDPGNTDAWRALGYAELDGKWQTQREFFEDRGYVFYRGKWRLPQVVDVMEEKSRIEILEREWFGRLRQWRLQLDGEHAIEAAEKLSSIRDPHALKAIAENLRKERSSRTRLLYVSSLVGIPDQRAIELLIATALSDPDIEVFHTCSEKIVGLQRSGLAKSIVGSLQDRRNVRVNRTAYILGELGDRDVIPALITKLVTTHYVTAAGSGQITTTLVKSPNPAGATAQLANLPSDGISVGGSAEKIAYQVPNQEVLKALVRLSGGQTFGFDARAWTNWWAISSRQPPITRALK
jgi:hypothetical protein